MATRLAAAVVLTVAARAAEAQDCTAVPLNKCGTDWYNNCLQCGTKSGFDCEKCCPGCAPVSKGDGTKYCDNCGSGPSPPGPSPPAPAGGDYLCYGGSCYDKPGSGTQSKSACEAACGAAPPSGDDSWDQYQAGGMDVTSVTGGKDKNAYDKVVVMLHGGGGSGSDWQYQYQQGWFGDLTGIKYVFPTSPISSHVWYISFKNGCGLKDDCAYNMSSINYAASAVAALIDHEKSLKGLASSKVYLAGFSEGAQLTGYVQLAKLDYALGGAVVMDGYPLPPLCDMPGRSGAKKNATYYGSDMKWMIWHGDQDPIFPVTETMNAWDGIFDALDIKSTLKIRHIESGMSHTLVQSEFEQMVSFIRG